MRSYIRTGSKRSFISSNEEAERIWADGETEELKLFLTRWRFEREKSKRVALDPKQAMND